MNFWRDLLLLAFTWLTIVAVLFLTFVRAV